MDHDEQPTGGQPFFWRVAEGVLYAEMPFSASIRPPLLTDWESQRAESFHSRQRRNLWLAGRALAKALVRERLQLNGMVEIREGVGGEPLVFRDGLPEPGVWLGIIYRHGRVAAVVADRPVSLDIRRVEADAADLTSRFVSRGEMRNLRRVFAAPQLACGVAWAVKEAALRAARCDVDGTSLTGVQLHADLGVTVGDVRLHTLALRVFDESVVAIVGRPLLHEQPVTRIVMEGEPQVEAASRLQAVVERSVARARRIAEARARWQGLRWQT